MLVLVELFEFEVIATSELGIASSHRVGGFQQMVAEETVAGLDETGAVSRRGRRVLQQKPGIEYV